MGVYYGTSDNSSSLTILLDEDASLKMIALVDFSTKSTVPLG
jgi:hypothetical protein